MAKEYILSAKDEARLAVWHCQAQARKEQGHGEGPCITISREFGCQAYSLAIELARSLGEPWAVVDRGILEEVAKVSGFSVEQIEKSRDTPPALKAIFAMFLDGSRAEETQLFEPLRQAMRKFAAAGNCIIVGSGGVVATQKMANIFHLRLVAPQEFRIDTIMKGHSLERSRAVEFVELHQKQRDDFVTRLTGERLDDPLRYHLVLNNSRFSTEQMAAVVINGLQQLGVKS